MLFISWLHLEQHLRLVEGMPEGGNNPSDDYRIGKCRIYLSNLLCKSSVECPQGAGVAFTHRHKTHRHLSPFIACVDASFAIALFGLWPDYMFHAC